MATPTALIKDLEGEVSVTRNGEVVNLKAGDSLLAGDVVKTGETGRLALEFPGVDGQIPAAGIMSPNGKITLGEQAGVNGQQLVVLEDGECFEFTSELAENSAAAEGSATSGLFGGLMGAAAGGGATAGLGAIAAGAFLAGGSGGGGDSGGNLGTAGTGGGTGTGGGSPLGGLGSAEFSSADSPQSIEELAQENLTQENLENSILQPIQNAVEASAENPASTPDNIATAVEQVALGGAENVHDALVAITGEGTPQADVVNQLVDGLNSTPLGEPLSPVTTVLQDIVNTDLGFDTLLEAAPVELADGGILSAVVDTASDLLEPVSAQVEPIDTLLNQLADVAAEVDTVLDGIVGSLSDGISDGLARLEGGSSTGDFALPEGLEAPAELSALTDQVEGLLGGADTLTAALQGAGGGSSDCGDLMGSLTSGISSGADALGGAGLPVDASQLPSV